MVHLVSYSLRGYRHPAVYQNIGEVIRGISGVWCHLGESRWLVETDLSEADVASRLAPHTVIGDQIFGARIYPGWRAYGLTQEQLLWLQGRNYMSFYERLLAFLPIPKPVQAAAKAAPSLVEALKALGQ